MGVPCGGIGVAVGEGVGNVVEVDVRTTAGRREPGDARCSLTPDQGEQPGPQAGVTAVTGQALPGADENFLYDVLDVGRVVDRAAYRYSAAPWRFTMAAKASRSPSPARRASTSSLGTSAGAVLDGEG